MRRITKPSLALRLAHRKPSMKIHYFLKKVQAFFLIHFSTLSPKRLELVEKHNLRPEAEEGKIHYMILQIYFVVFKTPQNEYHVIKIAKKKVESG